MTATDPRAVFNVNALAWEQHLRSSRTPAERAGDPLPAELEREAAAAEQYEAAVVALDAARARLQDAIAAEYAATLANTSDGSYVVSIGGDSSAVAAARLDAADAERGAERLLVRLNNIREANAWAGQQRRAKAERKAAKG